MKKYLLLLFFILTVLLSACKKNQLHNSDTKLIDSIHYYFNKVDDKSLNDSIKSSYNRRAYTLIKKIENDSIKFKYSFKSGARFYNLECFEEYKKLSEDIIENSIKVQNDSVEAKGYIYLGDYYLMQNKFDSAFYFYDKAEVKYILKRNAVRTNEVRIKKATIQYFKNDYIGTETTILKALPFLIENGDRELLFNSFNMIGLCRIETHEFEEALVYFNKSLKYADLLIPESGASEMLLNNIGFTYLMKKDYVKANSYFNSVLTKKTKKKFKKIFFDAKLNITYSKFKLGEIKYFEKEYAEILKNYKELNLSLVLPKIQLSEFYQSQNQLEKAQEFALEAYKVSIKDKVYRDKLIALKQLINVFPNKAKYYSNEYIKLADSITAVDKKIQNTFARIEYKVDELNNEKTLLQQEKEQFTLYTIIAFMLVLFLGTLLWFFQKQKRLKTENSVQMANQRIYQLMLDQQTKYEEGKVSERKRIARELHDSIMNKLTAIRFNLYPLKEKTSQEVIEKSLHYIDEIHTVEKELRAISNDLNLISNDKNDNFEVLIQSIYAFVKDSDTKVYFKFEETLNWQSIKSNTKLQLYRIVQESVFNCIKHAKATQCTISFSKTPIAILLTIIDDGRGLGENKNAKGMGLKNIKERTKSIAGKIKIESEINKGTAIYITIPMEENTN